MHNPTPTSNTGLAFNGGGFDSLVEGLDYAARGETGFNYYGVRGELKQSLPFAELRDRAISAARRLRRLGLQRGERVALVADTSPEFHTFFFACQYAGLIPVPLPLLVNLGGREAYVRRLRTMIQSAGATVAIAPAELSEILTEATAPLGLAHVGSSEDFLALPEGGDLQPLGKDDICYIQYSSGSTSAPKGVVVTQRSLLSNGRGIITHGLAVRYGDRGVSWLPLYHDMGLVGFCLTPVLCQMSIDYLATLDFARRPSSWLQLIAANSGTLSFSPSFGYDLCIRRAGAGLPPSLDLSSWRVAGIGGDMVRPDVLSAFADVFAPNGFRATAFLPSYGLAETTLAASFAPLDCGIEIDAVDRDALAEGRAVPAAEDAEPHRIREFVRCGRTMPGHELLVATNDGQPAAEREVGRVMIKGPSVMAGYYDNPEATGAAIIEDGWLDTGDLGYMVDGSLVISGRSKDLIIHNGRNIWPQDIEWSVERLPGLRAGDAAAFSVPATDGGEAIIVTVQCRLSDSAARERLKNQIAATIRNAVGVDGSVVLVPPRSLPLTSSGKLSRAATRTEYLAGMYTAAPRETIRRLAAEG